MASVPIRSLEDLYKIGQCRSDLVELRLDYLESLDVFNPELVEPYRSRLIITIRETDEGGVNSYDDETKLSLLRDAVSRGFLVDIESGFAEKHSFDCRRQIVSRHYLKELPDYKEMEDFIEKYMETATTVKLAVKSGAGSRSSLIRLLGKYDNIAVMEADGESSSRLLYSVLGSRLLYCHAGEKTSPGQLGCDEATDILKILRADQ